ncbi:MAG: hypothetical protein M0P01_05305 [Treponema sp.]|nr:hypothetical protein [Treponema sp.]
MENTGIVTVADGTGSTDKIKVVWLRSGRRYVETSTLSEFGKDVNKIRCRRLMQKTASTGTYTQAESWDILDRTPVSAEFSIGSMREANQHGGGNWRWIPNTGEYLVLRRLNVQLKNRSGMKLKPVTGSSYNIKLAGAYDRIVKADTTTGESTAPASPGNIDNNKASSFEVAFLETSYTVTPKGKMSSTEPDGSDKKLYSFSLTAGTDPVMHISAAGRLCTPDGKEAAIGIRPESAEKAYPGDDLILTFTAEDKKGKGPKLTIQAKASDYIAVYDKKLLWRANSYIKKQEAALGNMDWNNAHPWTGEEGYGANDWLGTDNSTGDNKGGQGTILSWTRWNDNEQVDKTVAYGWGCWDSVSDFNSKLTAQSNAIEVKRNTDTTYSQLNWVEGQTTAPGTSWHNYLFGQRKIEVGQTTKDGVSVNYNYYKYGTAAAGVLQHQYVSTSLITVPGFSTFMAFNGTSAGNTNNINNINYASISGNANSPFSGSYHPDQTDYTSGIDCSGFATEVADYKGNPYGIGNTKLSTGDFCNTYGKAFYEDMQTNSNGNEIPIPWDLKNDANLQSILSCAVPGDLLVISGDHVVIIQDLTYEEGKEDAEGNPYIDNYADVDVIHSTQGGKNQEKEWDVQCGTWDDLGTTKKLNYRLRRYK